MAAEPVNMSNIDMGDDGVLTITDRRGKQVRLCFHRQTGRTQLPAWNEDTQQRVTVTVESCVVCSAVDANYTTGHLRTPRILPPPKENPHG